MSPRDKVGGLQFGHSKPAWVLGLGPRNADHMELHAKREDLDGARSHELLNSSQQGPYLPKEKGK